MSLNDRFRPKADTRPLNHAYQCVHWTPVAMSISIYPMTGC